MDFPSVLNAVNSILWIAGNILLSYTAVMLVIFVIAYYAIFDPKATTGGKFIFRFILSLSGVIAMVFVSIFIDPSPEQKWYLFPEGSIDWWHPSVRVFVFSYIAYTTTSLAVLLALRKWWPHKVKKASDIGLVKLRHTSDIPITFK